VPEAGKLLIFAGAALLVLGVVLLVAGRIPFLGRLPGDISFSRGNIHFYFPLVTMLLVSLLLTVLLNMFFRR
jgi:hypothetical protein